MGNYEYVKNKHKFGDPSCSASPKSLIPHFVNISSAFSPLVPSSRAEDGKNDRERSVTGDKKRRRQPSTFCLVKIYPRDLNLSSPPLEIFDRNDWRLGTIIAKCACFLLLFLRSFRQKSVSAAVSPSNMKCAFVLAPLAHSVVYRVRGYGHVLTRMKEDILSCCDIH